MKPLITLAIAVLMLLLPIGVHSQDPYTEEIEKIEDSIRSIMEINQIPGLSIAIYKDEFNWSQGYGYSDLENNVQASPETAYIIASVMKSMTALAVVKLAADGKIYLDKEIQDYVPYYPRKKWPVTIRQVLGHQAGIGCDEFIWEEYTDKITYDSKQAIDVFKDCDLMFEPGTKAQYSSLGYNLLGLLIEEVSGMSFEEYMKDNIWGPLGMKNTQLDSKDLIPNRARGYDLRDNAIRNSDYANNSLWFATGGGRTTVLDLVRFAKGLDKDLVLSRSAQQIIYEAMETKDGERTNFGMGLTVLTSGRWQIVCKTGGQYGASSFLFRIPGENFAVALACNLGNVSNELSKIANNAAELILKQDSVTGDL